MAKCRKNHKKHRLTEPVTKVISNSASGKLHCTMVRLATIRGTQEGGTGGKAPPFKYKAGGDEVRVGRLG